MSVEIVTMTKIGMILVAGLMILSCVLAWPMLTKMWQPYHASKYSNSCVLSTKVHCN